MASLKDIRRRCLGDYGLQSGFFGAEDEEFPMPLMEVWINEAHREVAAETLCYRETQTYDLPVSSAGVSVVNLDCNVIKLVPETGILQAYIGGVWRHLSIIDEFDAINRFGPFDEYATGESGYCFLRSGSTLEGQRQLVLLPGAATAVSSGIKVPAYIYPGYMDAETQAPALQPAENHPIYPLVCEKMAASQMAKGVQSAMAWAQYFRSRADLKMADLRRITEEFRRNGPRRVRATYDAW